MKRFLTAAIALSLVGGSAAMAQPYGNDRHDRRDERQDNGQHRGHSWSKGQRLPSEYRSRGHYVDYRRYHLRAPPRGYQWVRVDDNYMLVAVTSGLIASIIAANR